MSFSKKELLEGRVATALTLRNFDNEMRRLKVTKLPPRLAGERKMMVRNLEAFGGTPWIYSSVVDNSWIP